MDTPSDELRGSAPSRKRRLTSTILLIVFCLSVVLSLVAGWARLQIEDTDRYVETVAPLASEPAVQNALTDRVTARLSEQLDERVTIDLIENSALAAPLALLVEQYIHDTVYSFVTSDRFPVVWEQINRAAHPVVTAALTGSGTESISTSQGQITLDLAPLMTEVINRLSDRGLDIVDRIQLDQLDTTFVIYESEDLTSAQDALNLLEQLAVVLPIIAGVSLVAAILVSTSRRSAVIRAGLGLAATMAVFLMLLAFLRWWTVENLPPDASPEAATVFFETLGRSLRDAARLLTVIGLVIAGVAFITRPAARLRRGERAGRGNVKAAWTSTRERWPSLTQAESWSDSHRIAIALAIGVAGCLLVVALDPIEANSALWILIVTAMAFGTLALIHARMPATSLASTPIAALQADMTSVPGPVAASDSISQRAAPDSLAPADGSRDELIAIASELSAGDLRILSRVAAALRDTR